MSERIGGTYVHGSSDSAISILSFWIVLGLAIWLSDWVPFRSEVTVYEAACAKLEDDGSCFAKNEIPGIRTNYRPDTETKSVVFWVDGLPPQKFDNCAVADVQNWSCPDYQLFNSMVDGKLSGREEGVYPHQIVKFKWWWLKLKKM